MTTLNDEGLVDGITRPLDPSITITPVPIGDPPIIVPGPTTTVPAPTNLQANATQNSVSLTWQDNSNNEDGFRIRRRGPTDADFIDIAEVPPNVTIYTDNNIQPQTIYTYRVRSFRAGGGGGVSNDAIVTTPSTQPTTVAAPTNLQANATQNSVTLRWQDNSNNEDGFRIRRRGPTDADFIDIADVPPNVIVYNDNSIQPQTTYTYRVRSFRAGGGGGVSNDAIVTTPATQPTTVAAPTNLQANATQNSVTLTWQDNSNNEDGFRIRRRGPTDADFIDIAEVPPNVTIYTDNNVQPQTTYTYRVRSFRSGGGGGVSNDAIVTTPSTQPTTVAAPTNLQANATQNNVTLTWQDNSNNEDGFRIRRRGPTDADFIDIADVPPNVTVYTDNNIQPQTTYTYRVRSFRAGGGGGVSNDATVTTPATQPTTVAAPTNLQANATQNSVTLTWQDNSNNEDGFRIRRRGPTDADFIDIAEVPPNVTIYSDNNIQPQTTYTYRVRSFRAGGGGGVSNDATVTTPSTQPTTVAAPTNLQASTVTGKVTLTWQDNSNNEDGFRIRRRGPTDADFIDIADVPPNVTTYTDNNVQPQKTYTYRVRSFRSGGGGGVSNDATVTTPSTSRRRELSSSAKGSNTVVAGGRISIPVGQFQLTVDGFPTLEFVNAFAMLVPPDPTVTITISPMNPIETFTNVTVTLDTKIDTPPRTYDLIVGGQSTDVPGPEGAYKPQTIPVEVQAPPTVTLSVSPTTRTIRVGDRTTYQVTLQRNAKANGIAIELDVNDKQLPDGVTATFDPPNPTGNTSQLTITTDRAAVPINLEGVDLRIRSKTSGVKMTPAMARLRFKPEATFMAMPAMETVKRGGSKMFTVTASRMYYNGPLKLDLTARGKQPSFTPTLRPAGFDEGSEFDLEIKILNNTQPDDYTFVATPRFPDNVKDGIPTEATIQLKVENAIAPSIVRVVEKVANIKPNKKLELTLELDSASFAAPVTVELQTTNLPQGVKLVSPSTIELKRPGFNGVETFTLQSDNFAVGSGSIGFTGRVNSMPDVPVQFEPAELPVNVLTAGSVVLGVIGGTLDVFQGDDAEYVVTVDGTGYTGNVHIEVINAPGPVKFMDDVQDVMLGGTTKFGRVFFTVDTDNVEPKTYTFDVLASAIPAAQLFPDRVTVPLKVIPPPDRTMQPPTIGSFAPGMGRSGDVITISGAGFVAGATQVSLSGVSAEIVSLTDMQLSVRIPNDVSSGKFTIQTPAGSVTSADPFTIVATAPQLAAPTNLRATLAGSQVNLRWDDNSEEDGFRIERRAMSGAYQPIATVSRGATSFADASVTPGATYFYRVRAFAGAVESVASNEIGVSVPLPQPTASVRLSIVPASLRVNPGAIATFTVALARTNYAGPLDLTVEGLPFGAIATFSDDPANGNSSILTIANPQSVPGLYRLTVRGAANGVTVEPAMATVTVTSPPRIPILPGPGPIRPRPGVDLRPGFLNPEVE